MSLYGYPRKTTPNIDRFKDKFIIFTNAFSQATATSCSMRHLFTGRYSSRLMLQKEGIDPFFLNELVAAGYDKFHLNIIGSDYNGISAEAFTRDMPADLRPRVRIEVWPDTDDRKKVGPLLKYPDDNDPRGTFAYVHLTTTHTPWTRKEGAPDFGDGQSNLYDHSIAFCDQEVGKLLDGLSKRGILDESIVIIAADHGTGLNEHGRFGGFHPWREQIQIPLLMHVPGMKGKRVDSLVGLFDVGPMLVEALTDSPTDKYDGQSLWPAIMGADKIEPRTLFGLNSFDDCYYLVKSDGTHYIWHRSKQFEALFDYRKDSLERHGLLSSTMLRDKCRGEMAWFYATGKGRYTHPSHY